MKLGKKEKAWIKERLRQKKISVSLNILSCEFQFDGCQGSENLGYSHPEKRRKTLDLSVCVLACGFCHAEVENHENKIELHEQALAGREERYWEAV